MTPTKKRRCPDLQSPSNSQELTDQSSFTSQTSSNSAKWQQQPSKFAERKRESISKRIAGLNLSREDQILVRGILSASEPEPRKVYETPEDKRKFDQREAEDRRIPHRANVVRKWRDEAKRVKDNAPAIPAHGCVWYISQTASHDPQLDRIIEKECGALNCGHCAQVWKAKRINEALDEFADCTEVTVLALDDDDDDERKRFAERHKKRRQRKRRDGIPLLKHDLAMVVPVANARFFVIAGHPDRTGERIPLGDALQMLSNAIDDRITLANLTGKDADGRKVSWPGRPRNSKKTEDVPKISVEEQKAGDNRDNPPTWITNSGTDEPVNPASVRAVLDGDGIAAKVTRTSKRETRIRYKTLNDADKGRSSLTKSLNLRDKDSLDETNVERSARMAWENEMAQSQLVFA